MSKKITMRDFFALASVVAAQAVQKRFPHGSKEHREAFEAIVVEAKAYGVEEYFEDAY